MKGFTLKFGNEIIPGAVNKGSSGVIISNKEWDFRLCFHGMDAEGLFPTWYEQDLKIGDSFTISYEDIDESNISQPIHIRDVTDLEGEDRLLLESYHRLKKQLMDEGLI
ncbi:MAG: hypothetical protein LLG05_18635 [Porphyromonadaceae bacterium]|nr:hypothetical protein [Porphyromonadaceae bacterium]